MIMDHPLLVVIIHQTEKEDRERDREREKEREREREGVYLGGAEVLPSDGTHLLPVAVSEARVEQSCNQTLQLLETIHTSLGLRREGEREGGREGGREGERA